MENQGGSNLRSQHETKGKVRTQAARVVAGPMLSLTGAIHSSLASESSSSEQIEITGADLVDSWKAPFTHGTSLKSKGECPSDCWHEFHTAIR